MKKFVGLWLVLLLVLTAGCAPAAPAAQATATPSAAAATPAVTATLVPTQTAQQSVSTATPQITAEATAAAEATKAPATQKVTAKPTVKATAKPTKAPAPTPSPTAKPTKAPALQVTISIDCATAVANRDQLKEGVTIPDNGVILGKTKVTIEAGESVYDVLKRVCGQKGIALKVSGSGSSVYVQGIGGLREFDCGKQSGWQYFVNGSYVSTGCGRYTLQGGERIEFKYTCASGSDL